MDVLDLKIIEIYEINAKWIYWVRSDFNLEVNPFLDFWKSTYNFFKFHLITILSVFKTGLFDYEFNMLCVNL